KKGYSDDVSFRQVQTHGHVYGDAYYLTIEERNQVYQCQYGRSYHASLVRDMFVFQCLVGCRMGDLFNLTRSNIIDGWLEYIPGKNLNNGNTELVRVPLSDTAKEILARYSHVSPRLFPAICEAQYNMYIKFVLDFAGIHRMVTVLNPLTRQPEQRMLCDVATSHTARKTFIGNLYAKVKDQALVSSLTGHSPQSRAFQRYRTIDDTMKRELIGMLEE
ncbi:MAG: site-specific integrase, partial [Prevotella sp.]